MYGIFTYIWVIFRANVGKYSIHGAYGMHMGYIVGCNPRIFHKMVDFPTKSPLNFD